MDDTIPNRWNYDDFDNPYALGWATGYMDAQACSGDIGMPKWRVFTNIVGIWPK